VLNITFALSSNKKVTLSCGCDCKVKNRDEDTKSAVGVLVKILFLILAACGCYWLMGNCGSFRRIKENEVVKEKVLTELRVKQRERSLEDDTAI
jgi:hypothetical protein